MDQTIIIVLIFVALTENSSIVTYDTQGQWEEPLEKAVVIYFTKQKYSGVFTYLWRGHLVATSKLGLLTIKCHSKTRKKTYSCIFNMTATNSVLLLKSLSTDLMIQIQF